MNKTRFEVTTALALNETYGAIVTASAYLGYTTGISTGFELTEEALAVFEGADIAAALLMGSTLVAGPVLVLGAGAGLLALAMSRDDQVDSVGTYADMLPAFASPVVTALVPLSSAFSPRDDPTRYARIAGAAMDAGGIFSESALDAGTALGLTLLSAPSTYSDVTSEWQYLNSNSLTGSAGGSAGLGTNVPISLSTLSNSWNGGFVPFPVTDSPAFDFGNDGYSGTSFSTSITSGTSVNAGFVLPGTGDYDPLGNQDGFNGPESGGTQSGGAELGGSQSGGSEAGGSQSGGTEAGGSQTNGGEAGSAQSGGAPQGITQPGGSQSNDNGSSEDDP